MDPSLPQLEVAKDPNLIREVLQRHMRSLGGKAYQLRECRISYSYHRQGNRCVVQYALRFAEPGTWRERTQVVTGVMYAGGRTRRIWKKLRRSEPKRGIVDAVFPPFSYVPDLDMLVQVFPYDNRLPGLSFLMAEPLPDLEPLLLARFGSGEWQAEAWDVEPVRYIPDLRATVRLVVRARDAVSGRTEERRFYAKVYRDEEKGEQKHRVLRELWDKVSGGGAGFTMGRPIAYLSALRTLLQEEVPGAPLEDILGREEEEATQALRRAARALASLHLLEVVVPQRRPLQDEIRGWERVGKLLQSRCPHLGPRIEEILGTVVAGLEESSLAPIHGDLMLEHIILDDDSVGLIDLDQCAMADPVLDVARFLVILTKVPPRSPLPHDRSREFARAFAEEYFAHVPEAWRARLPLHYAGAILRHAYVLTTWFDEIEALEIEALLEEAKDSLAGRI